MAEGNNTSSDIDSRTTSSEKRKTVSSSWLSRLEDAFRKHANPVTVIFAILALILTVLIAASENRVGFKQDVIDDMNRDIVQLKDEKKRATDSLEKMNISLMESNESLAKMNVANTQLGQKIQSLQDENKDLNESRRKLETENLTQTSRIQTLESENEKAKAQVTSLSSEVSYLRQRINAYREELAAPGQRDYQTAILRTNELLRNFQLVPWPISISGWDIEASYIIKRTAAEGDRLPFELISFEPTKYTLDSGFQCLKMADLCSELCSLIDKAVLAYNNEASASYRAAYERLMNKEYQLDLGSERAIIAELSVLARVMREVSDSSHLFLRGTADGQEQSWSRPLIDEYMFETIDRFIENRNQCAGSRIDCWEFSDSQAMTVTNPYNEQHLPNLRARYIEANTVSILGSCRSSSTPLSNIRVLEGIDNENIAGRSRSVLGLIIIGRPR